MTNIQNTAPHLPSFPDSVLHPKRKRNSRRRIIAGVVVIALVGAAAATALPLDFETETGSYRTATVTTQELDEASTNVATIEPVTQAEVAFPVAGTVAAVDVAVGDEVALGDTLATLDTEELEEALRVSQAELAQAELVLSVALDGDDPSSITGGAIGVSADEEATIQLAVYRPEQAASFQLVAAMNEEVAAAQQAVLAAQQAVDEAMTQAAAALDSATLICAAVDGDTIEACRTALAEVSSAQEAVSDAQAELAAAATHLDDLLEQWAQDLEDESSTTTTTPPGDTTTTTPEEPPSTTIPDDGTSTPPSTPGPTPPATTPGDLPDDGEMPRGGETPGGSTGGGFTSGGAAPAAETPSSEDLIAYQSAVDAAALQVDVAEQALAQASIVSPISGTVTAVAIAPGDEVSSSTDTQTIVVEGEGGYEATLMVSVSEIPDIELGQPASLLPDGSDSPLTGEVVRISAVPASNTTTYQVTVALEDASMSLASGNIGDIQIVTGQTDSVLAVPASAVTLEGTTHTVTVIDEDETASTVDVTIGVVGEDWVEITSDNLSEGQRVVIADLDEPLPGSATEVTETNGFTVPGGGEIQFPAGGPELQGGPGA